MNHTTRSALIPSLFLLLITRGAFAAPTSGYQEGWNVSGDTAGWQANSSVAAVSVHDTGGNPGGYLYSAGLGFQHRDIGAYTDLPDATGDFSTSGGVWRASFDLLYISGTFDDAWLRFRYQDAGYNGWKYSIGTGFTTTGDWTSYDVQFDQSWSDAEAMAAGWIQDLPSPDWSTTMTNAFNTEIRLSGEGNLEAGIDNFRLTAVAAPTPGTQLLFAAGLVALGIARRSAVFVKQPAITAPL